MAAFMRGDFAPRDKANFNPDQPRDELGNGRMAIDAERASATVLLAACAMRRSIRIATDGCA